MLKNGLFSLLCAIVFLSCKRIDDPFISNVSILGHAGMGHSSQYPMNSLESVLSAFALNVDGVEIDVQMTKDSVLIAYHEEQLQLNTTGSGWISENTWAAVSQTYFTDYPHAKYRIRTLDEIAAVVKNYPGAILNLDLKQLGPGTDEAYKQRFVRKLNDFASRMQLGERLVFSTADTALIDLLHADNPYYKILLYVNDMAAAKAYSKPGNVQGVLIRNSNVNSIEAEIVNQSNWRLWVWAVRDAKDVRNAVAKKSNYIIADNVRTVMKSVGRNKQD
jgi:glycerophosphoryl diester phosphodiesterase